MTTPVRTALPILALGVMALLAGAMAAPSRGAAQDADTAGHVAVPGKENPHGREDACAVCHEGTAPTDDVGPASLDAALCRDCHPRDRMYLGCLEEKAHPIGQEPKTATIPADWPLLDGTVTCATCHAEPGCDSSRSQDPPYHRDGPYIDEFSLCWKCHEADTVERSNPHRPEEWRVAERTCTACHAGLPETGATPERSRLRGPEAEVCATCHPVPLHLGSAAHLGKQVEGFDPTFAAGLIAVDEQGRIWCWTCHEVHGDGDRIHPDLPPPPVNDLRELRSGYKSLPGPEVLDGLRQDRVLDPPEPGPDYQPLLALPADDGSLCRACHGEGPR